MRPAGVSRSASPNPVILRIMNAPSIPEMPFHAVKKAWAIDDAATDVDRIFTQHILEAAEDPHVDDADLQICVKHIEFRENGERRDHAPTVIQFDPAVKLQISATQWCAVMLKADSERASRHIKPHAAHPIHHIAVDGESVQKTGRDAAYFPAVCAVAAENAWTDGIERQTEDRHTVGITVQIRSADAAVAPLELATYAVTCLTIDERTLIARAIHPRRAAIAARVF